MREAAEQVAQPLYRLSAEVHAGLGVHWPEPLHGLQAAAGATVAVAARSPSARVTGLSLL